MKIDRRRLLTLLGVGAAAGGASSARAEEAVSFNHGVACGDPLTDRMIFWTRVTPPAGASGQIQGELRIGTDPKLEREGLAKFLKVGASAERDWTVKVDASGLKAGTEYFYQFRFGDALSPIGRGRTLPAGKVKDVVLAVVSCSLYPAGYFNAYGALAKLERLDAVVHLGDYIYEYGAAPGDYGMNSPTAKARVLDPPHEIVSLDDYRRRHACYKTDPQLQAAHARAPWIVVWDDHETANDSWAGGAENHNPGEGEWASRKAAALKAYFEWMPIREPAAAMPEAINRSFRFGDLASLIMTETRLTARGHPLDLETDLKIVDGLPDLPAFFKLLNDPSRQLMGPKQEAWFGEELKRSVKDGEAWQVIGNQIVMARTYAPNLRKQMGEEAWGQVMAALPPEIAKRVAMSSALSAVDVPLNLDQWDGYPAARERVYGMFKDAGARPIVLAGDSHSFWANELHDDAGKLVAAEFGATGVTSPGFEDLLPGLPLNEAFVARNKEIKFADSAAKGFVKLTLTRESAVAEMVAVSTIHAPDYEAKTIATFTVKPDGTGVSGLS